MYITEDIKYIGVNDHQIDLFEGQYNVPAGMAYNSYLIMDQKTAVMDSVDVHFAQEWLDNIAQALNGRELDYIVVQHMEPDHSSSLAKFLQAYPQAKVVSSAKAFAMMKNFFGTDYADRQVVVGEGSTLSLGAHQLNFVTAPMVHWPEVIMTYDSTDKVVFSADAFGKFGALDVEEDWTDEARRYYIGIVGKYGAQVQALLKKVAGLEINTICPLHGPVLKENLGYYIDLYDKWSSYTPEKQGVVVAYTSVYGNTEQAAKLLAEKLAAKGETVVVYDLARSDMSQAVADAFSYDRLVLATTTYNGDIFPYMKEFINHLTERGFCNRKLAIIENGSWAPVAVRIIKTMLEKSKNLTFSENNVKILSALNSDSLAQLDALADELGGKAENREETEQNNSTKRRFECSVCGYVYEGDSLPEDYICPICQLGADVFEEI